MHPLSLFITLFAALVLFPAFSSGQAESFRSSSNPHYWKNKKPFEGYWQQDVYYRLKANIDENTDIVDGSQQLTYWNNSPDELPFVYFHLYSNAQTKNSYLSDLYKNNDIKTTYGKYQQQDLGTKVNTISVNGTDLKTELDNTILKAWLPSPLKPGESVTFNITFKTYFDRGSIRNRMKMFNASGYKHYDLVHWYPRLSVYDRKLGWDTDQHMDHEFYGDFGVFDVELTFGSNYIVDGTGIMTNRDEVLPADLLQKLDIRNFKDKPWGEKPSVIVAPDGPRKTWRFRAENVHDVAYTADPTYRIGEAEWNGIKCISLVQEPHARRWQNAASYAAQVIKVNSEDFGMYNYPKMIVADAQDGMEYPMLTLDGGWDPDYRDLLAHEISHNWFFGMLGTNETYRPLLDEGFTQFVTTWTYMKIDGKERVRGTPRSKYVRKYLEPDLIMNSEVYSSYMNDAVRASDVVINTHADMFNGAIRHGGGYGQVYSKTATMLWNMQYVLGDELFLKSMQHYVEQWKFAHPYVEDFRNSIIQYTRVDLNWFFDQWLETSKTIDYSVESVKKGKGKDEYIITFGRDGRMQMPIDFTVYTADSGAYEFHIPNTWFVKQTKATVLPRWIGWDNVKKTYEATVKIPGKIYSVRIDPTNRLADVNMLNNSSKFPLKYRFDSRIYNAPDWTKYELFSRPDVWWNGYDGFKVGLHMEGHYMNYKDIFSASVWFNTGISQLNLDSASGINRFDDVSGNIDYRTPTDKLVKGSAFLLNLRSLDGLHGGHVGFEMRDKKGNNRWFANYKVMYRENHYSLNYLLYPKEWVTNRFNSSLNLGLEHTYNYHRGNGNILINLRSSSVASDYDYASVSMAVVNRNVIGKFNFNTRTYVQYGTGKNWASESQLYLAGASPEAMMDNKYTRSQGAFSPEWAGHGASTNYFHAGGGLNLRGYAGYLAPEFDNNDIQRYTYKGTSGASVNAELEFDRLFKVKPILKGMFKVNTYLFGDAGIINYNYPDEKLAFPGFRADAGVGTALTIKRWGPLQTVNPLTIRFDVPLFLSRPPATDTDFVQFRWIIGINRAF